MLLTFGCTEVTRAGTGPAALGREFRATAHIAWADPAEFRTVAACRLSKDREKSVLSSESFIKLAMIQLMLHRLELSDVDPEFRYPRPVAA